MTDTRDQQGSQNTTPDSASSVGAGSMSNPSHPGPGGVSLRIVVTVLLLLIPVGLVASVWVFEVDLAGFNPMRATRVPVTGVITYEGKPVNVGFVSTDLVDGQGMGALGALDGEGRFTLTTNGKPGALQGKHKLAVVAMSSGMPPVPVVPVDYTQTRTSPLQIEVTSDPSANHFEIDLPEIKRDKQPGEEDWPGAGMWDRTMQSHGEDRLDAGPRVNVADETQGANQSSDERDSDLDAAEPRPQ